jgi:hypothetical protein
MKRAGDKSWTLFLCRPAALGLGFHFLSSQR